MTACRSRRPDTFLVEQPTGPVVADGESHLLLHLRAPNESAIDPADLSAKVNGPSGRFVGIIRRQASVFLDVVPSVNPGRVNVEVRARNMRAVHMAFETVPDDGDTFRDGTPDFLRLTNPHDQAAFRRWFTLLAERQAVSPAPASTEIHDCAALLRYAYREAMRRHDSAWATEAKLGGLPAASDIARYSFPYTPLGPRLFRTKQGTFSRSDLDDGTFAEFADARTLIMANVHFLSRDVRRARQGDLLFFRQFGQQSPFHSMIFVGRSHFGAGDDWLVYHTGPEGKWPGEMRRVTVASLETHPRAQWRPLIGNPNFLGVYRWNILREAQ